MSKKTTRKYEERRKGAEVEKALLDQFGTGEKQIQIKQILMDY